MVMFWIFVTVAAIAIEILTVGNLICIWFAFGGAIACLLAYFNINEIWQYISFFFVSIVVMLVVRPLAAKYLRGNTVPTNSDRLIGSITTVNKEIKENEWGEVVINKATWSAVGVNNIAIKKGTKVTIVAIEGAKLIVKPLEQ